MALTKERRNEIAYQVVKSQAQKNGLGSMKANELLRSIGNKQEEAAKYGISREEAIEFNLEMMRDVFEEFHADLSKALEEK